MEDKYISVTALTRYIKYKLDNDKNLQEIYLKGEISNFKAHTRGHYYFTLKDENSRINAIMFSFNATKMKFMPEDGMKVLVKGKISVFESTGNYQIYVDEMQEDGIGNLHIAFEQLKKKLGDEGLFDAKYKKEIPKIPMKVGIITAPTGAAVKDILSTIKRRFPVCKTILFPCLVQGELAKDDIVKKLDIADNYGLDVIILDRGGGSIEDLWPFNEEVVARKVFACKTPIISGVGHQIDFTICDFVADKRAETPTGAAERAVPVLSDLLLEIKNKEAMLTKIIKNILDSNNLKLKKFLDSYVLKNPMGLYEIKEQKLDNLIDKLNTNINAILYTKRAKYELSTYNIVFKNPSILYEEKLNKTNHLIEKLSILNPLNSLKRGYTITKHNNKCISSINEIKIDDSIDILIKDGNIKAKITEVKNG